MEEKRELVYELSKWSHGAPEMLQSWTRREILQIMCAEMGKERKYTGLTKLKIIENLLKIVAEKKSQGQETEKSPDPQYSPAYDDNKDPSLWLTCSSEPPYQGNACGMSCHLECALRNDKSGIAKVGMDGSFSCTSCGKMNDLLGCWRKQLIMAKDTRRVDILCYRVSLSQKLLMGTKYYQNLCEIVDEAVKKLEAEVGPLTGLPVKKARGIVNRLSSGPEVQRLCAHAVESLDSMLSKTACNLSSDYEIQGQLYHQCCIALQNVIQFVDVCTSSAMMILGSKDPPLGSGMGYTLWHRKAEDMDYPAEPTCTLFTPNTRFLLSGLCPATEYFVKVFCFNSTRNIGKCEAQFRSGADDDVTNSKNLAVERNESPATNSSSLSNPSSVEDETNNENGKREEPILAYCNNIDTEKFASANVSNNVVDCAGTSQGGTLGDYVPLLDEEGATAKINSILNSNELNLENNESPEDQEMSTGTGSNTHVGKSTERVLFVGNSEAELPNTPYKLENFKDGPAINGRCKPSKKDLDCGSGREEEPSGNNNRDFEYYVKVIRWLECEGHVETSFRQKFLTWYSLKATPQEVRVVKVFVDTLIDDPASLAGQLVDAFLEIISSKRPAAVPSGFCLKLWH
ncbi:fibronectin type III domain-containing protein [Actinidia rufa]|uniref:Fibronectin type III domain-containing protein n=1 Tax=Actinidia rufa TaxID=165716 RepID=A0A7J0GD68_9ERIC|nr:fibronectin type III domain-containing protein [Actinidia rufa]